MQNTHSGADITGLSFFVPGLPQTQAGMRAVNTARGPRLISTGSAALEQWRKVITKVAVLAKRNMAPIIGPVRLSTIFYLPMPKSRPAALCRTGYGPAMAKYDFDKLIRAVSDSLTAAKIYVDDQQIGYAPIGKMEVADHSLCGVEIAVCELDLKHIDNWYVRRLQWNARRSAVSVARGRH